MDLRPLSDPGAEERQLELCASCGHLRSQHPGGYPGHVWDHCLSTVPTPAGDYPTAPCPCTKYVPEPDRAS
jgi:hypothetical protein